MQVRSFELSDLKWDDRLTRLLDRASVVLTNHLDHLLGRSNMGANLVTDTFDPFSVRARARALS